MDRLTSKIALVSGGARGMGASHARAIVAEGGKVVVGDLLDDEGRALADELGDAARYVHLDVTSPDDWEAAVATAVSEFGGLNVLVNNAGIVNFGRLGTYTLDQWNLILGINVTGAFLGITAAKEALVASAGDHATTTAAGVPRSSPVASRTRAAGSPSSVVCSGSPTTVPTPGSQLGRRAATASATRSVLVAGTRPSATAAGTVTT